MLRATVCFGADCRAEIIRMLVQWYRRDLPFWSAAKNKSLLDRADPNVITHHTLLRLDVWCASCQLGKGQKPDQSGGSTRAVWVH